MPIELIFFGNLTNKIEGQEVEVGMPLTLDIDDTEIETVYDILKKYQIHEEETSHIFVNHRYAGLKKRVKDGDRVAIFPKSMILLYKWYFKKEEDE